MVVAMDACHSCGQGVFVREVLPPHEAGHRDPTITVLRRWNRRDGGDVIALFPDNEGTGFTWPACGSYMHVGQHGGADYYRVIEQTRPVSPEEADAKALLEELRTLGYEPILRKRWTPR